MSPTVLVTGATDGLGRAVAARLAAEGASVVVHGRDPARAEEVAGEVGAVGTVVADLSDLSDLSRVAATAEEVRSRWDLDVLVNNAGVGSGEPDGRTRRTSADGRASSRRS